MSESEDPYSPYVGVTANPWPGQVGVFKTSASGAYELNTPVSERAKVGVSETELLRADTGVVDRGAALQVKMASGELDSASWSSVIAGANIIAIGSESTGDWEVFQFAEAELISPDTYLLRSRLRGLFGTDCIMPASWPVGSKIVVLNDAVSQLSLTPSTLGLSQNYRVGPVSRPLDDSAFVQEALAFSGVGLRPYKPCHISKVGDVFSWIRRTRVGGDNWISSSVPVGEETEEYVVRIKLDGQIVRSESVLEPQWEYSASDRANDGVGEDFEFEVAQVSAEVGPGVFASYSVGV